MSKMWEMSGMCRICRKYGMSGMYKRNRICGMCRMCRMYGRQVLSRIYWIYRMCRIFRKYGSCCMLSLLRKSIWMLNIRNIWKLRNEHTIYIIKRWAHMISQTSWLIFGVIHLAKGNIHIHFHMMKIASGSKGRVPDNFGRTVLQRGIIKRVILIYLWSGGAVIFINMIHYYLQNCHLCY